MERLPRWADIVLVPLVSLTLAAIIAALVIIAIFGPWLSPYDFLSQNLDLQCC